MTKKSAPSFLTTLALAAALVGASPAGAQVAGGTTVENVTVTAMTQLAMGWSVKKTLLGKTIQAGRDEEGHRRALEGIRGQRECRHCPAAQVHRCGHWLMVG